MSRNKAFLLGGIAIIVITAIVVTVALLSKPKTGNDKLENSNTVSMVSDAVTVGSIQPGSLVVAPATDKWWESLLSFTDNEVVSSIDYNAISKDAKYVAYTNSAGVQYANLGSLGLSTTFLVYSSEKAAQEAQEALGGEIASVVKANLLIIVPNGAYSDVDYDLTKKIEKDVSLNEDDLDLQGRALWQIDFDDFKTAYTRDRDALDIEVYENTLKNIGITDGSKWVGYSSDGLDWKGNFILKDNAELKLAKPSDTINYLNNQVAFLKQDGSYAYGLNSVVPEDEQTGIIEPRQSVVTSYMRVSDNSETAGGFLNEETGKLDPSKPIKKGDGIYQVEIIPNEWLAFMMNENTSYPYTQYSKITLTITDLDGSSTIKLEPTK